MSTTRERVVDGTDQGGVTTEVRDRVMLIGIDRPRKRNALTPNIMSGLSEAYARFDKDDDLRDVPPENWPSQVVRSLMERRTECHKDSDSHSS